jgi:hypothetical protein
VQIIKYRDATKDGSVVKTKISWRNKNRHRGAIINIVVQQKKASRCNQKYRGATKEWHLGVFINIVV